MKPYTAYRYMYPPRPEHILHFDRLPYYEKQGWVGQYKKNGTCTLLWLSPEGEFTTMNRHAEPHKAWQLSKVAAEILREALPSGKWTVLLAELLHNKAPGIKDTLYFHDILVADSMFLMGETFMNRQAILEQLFPAKAEAYSHFVYTDKIWRAKVFTKDLLQRFQEIKNPKIDEGLVIKLPNAPLKMCDKASNNAGWQMKIRHPAKNYAY